VPLALVSLLALLLPRAHAQEVRPSDLVAAFESTATRPIIAEADRPQGYGGLAAGGLLSLGDGFALPVGGGFRVAQRTELGADLALGVVPFDVLHRARLYGRYGLVEDHLALQLGAWLPTEGGETLGLELMLPARWVGEHWEVYGQLRGLAVPAADKWVGGVGSSVLRRVVGPVGLGVDLGGALQSVAGARAPLLAGGPLASVALGRRTVVRGRLSFVDLLAEDVDGWAGTAARTAELIVVHQWRPSGG
jgi:hypothetical protein